MSEFNLELSVKSDIAKVLKLAQYQLAARGFRIQKNSDSSFEFVGPGFRSTRQDPILGASKIELHGQGEKIALHAELGALDGMRKFILIFPFALGLGLCSFFAILFLGILRFPNAWLFCLIPFCSIAPWLVIAPLMARGMSNRTKNSLTTFLQNVSLLSQE